MSAKLFVSQMSDSVLVPVCGKHPELSGELELIEEKARVVSVMVKTSGAMQSLLISAYG